MAKRPSQKIRKTLADLTKAFRRIEAPSMVIGGIAVIALAVPEDLVIYKALAWRDRDRYDIEQLLTLHGDHIDLDRVRTFVREFAQILDAPEQISEFDRLLYEVLGPA